MDQVLALRPFLPALDHDVSTRFYRALGFAVTHADDTITILKLESFSFILQRYHQPEWAANTMVQMLVRDVAAWWVRVDAGRLVADFGVRAPRAPAMQPWGMTVGFLFDPSGVLWHVAEAPF